MGEIVLISLAPVRITVGVFGAARHEVAFRIEILHRCKHGEHRKRMQENAGPDNDWGETDTSRWVSTDGPTFHKLAELFARACPEKQRRSDREQRIAALCGAAMHATALLEVARPFCEYCTAADELELEAKLERDAERHAAAGEPERDTSPQDG